MTRHWVPGDVVVLTLPMPALFMAGHPFIESTRSAVAIVRGPIVYCIEACDQPGSATEMTVTIDPNAALQSIWRPDVLGGATVVVGSGTARANEDWNELYRRFDDVSRDRQPIDVTAVPYFLWGNRERRIHERVDTDRKPVAPAQ